MIGRHGDAGQRPFWIDNLRFLADISATGPISLANDLQPPTLLWLRQPDTQRTRLCFWKNTGKSRIGFRDVMTARFFVRAGMSAN